jgi:hypothetical protein
MEEQLAELEERIDFATANQAKYSTLFFILKFQVAPALIF